MKKKQAKKNCPGGLAGLPEQNSRDRNKCNLSRRKEGAMPIFTYREDAVPLVSGDRNRKGGTPKNSCLIHFGITPEYLRLAAASLSKTEWRELMQCILFLIDVGVEDGRADNDRLIFAYLGECKP